MKRLKSSNVLALAIMVAAVCGPLSLTAWGDDSLEGIYTGSMQLTDETERSIPLAISLSFTGQTIALPSGEERQVIDGAFLIDEEGGPYAFSTVSFDLDKARFDLRYNRPQLNLSPEIPSSFRLVGYLQNDGSIQGKVSSGTRGPIGTFSVSRTNGGGLPIHRKYTGQWEGEAVLPSGARTPYRIVLVDGLSAYVNPPDYELDFTPGKVSYVKWNNTKFDISNVAIDYLRRKVTLSKAASSGNPGLSIEFYVDFDRNVVRGEIYSVFRGKAAEFELPRVESTTPHEGGNTPEGTWRDVVLDGDLAIGHGELSMSPTYSFNEMITTHNIRVTARGAACHAFPEAVWIYPEDKVVPEQLRALGSGTFDNHYFNKRFSFRRLSIGFDQRLTVESRCEIVLGVAPLKPIVQPPGPYRP